MKRVIIAAALVGVAASPLLAGGRDTVTGAYVEARTAEVFTGGCIMNSEAETVGKQAVLAWKVDRGSFNGISIDGLSVVAAMSGDRNLGMTEMGGEKPAVRTAMFVDQRANPAQQHRARRDGQRVVQRARRHDRPGDADADPVHRSRQRDQRLGRRRSSLDVSKHLTHEPTCGAMQWFHPFAHDRRRGDGRDRPAPLHRRRARHEVERPEQALGVLRDVQLLTHLGGIGRKGWRGRRSIFAASYPARPAHPASWSSLTKRRTDHWRQTHRSCGRARAGGARRRRRASATRARRPKPSRRRRSSRRPAAAPRCCRPISLNRPPAPRWCDAAVAALGRLDILINMASVYVQTALRRADRGRLERGARRRSARGVSLRARGRAAHARARAAAAS